MLIIEQIDAEISRLQQAKALLMNGDLKRGRGRSKVNDVVSRILAVAPTERGMSVEGKAKIAAAQKARWAKVRRAAKKAKASA